MGQPPGMSEGPCSNTTGDTIPSDVMPHSCNRAPFRFLRTRVEYEQLAFWVSVIWVVTLSCWPLVRRWCENDWAGWPGMGWRRCVPTLGVGSVPTSAGYAIPAIS